MGGARQSLRFNPATHRKPSPHSRVRSASPHSNPMQPYTPIHWLHQARNLASFCRPCFAANGGSKGECVACSKPVLILKSEGGYIENSGRLWHKRCFRCEGCQKDISHQPMVDLLGKPSCADCFDTCLKRDSPRRHESPRVDREDKKANLGGIRPGNRSRQGSPALEELEQKLGILTTKPGKQSHA
jgi:hypothetical protein